MENQESNAPAEQATSLGNRIMNVFAAPSEAFEGIASMESKTKLWVLPWITSMVIGAVFVFAMFSNQTLVQQMRDMRAKTMQEQVAQGKMTQEQADQAQDRIEQMGGFMSAIAIVGLVVVTSLYFFVGALVFWLVGKLALKSPEGYGTYLGLYGTAAWISVLGGIITSLMILGMGSLHATPSAALAVLSSYDPANSVHHILKNLDVFAVWQAVVLGIGLGKVTGKSSGTAIGISVGMWVVWAVGTGFLKFGG
jgi:Yip1 domain